jgi:hypothetical protein
MNMKNHLNFEFGINSGNLGNRDGGINCVAVRNNILSIYIRHI